VLMSQAVTGDNLFKARATKLTINVNYKIHFVDGSLPKPAEVDTPIESPVIYVDQGNTKNFNKDFPHMVT
ncbi:hypothetical protein A2U01_0053852, partial [Trifolium medium]|nr:hypothetical protein [Trifolium medium]